MAPGRNSRRNNTNRTVLEPGRNSKGNNTNKTVLVGNLPYNASPTELKDFFSKFGPVSEAELCERDFITGKPKGHALVQFKSVRGFRRAQNADKSTLYLKGRLLRVAEAKQGKQPNKRTCASSDDGDCKRRKTTIATESSSISTASVLIDDVLIKVLSLLNPFDRIRVERVCRQWKRCAQQAFKEQTHIIFKRRDFPCIRNYEVWGDFSLVLDNIMSRCSHKLISLDVRDISIRIYNKELDVIAKCCPGLECLYMLGRASLDDHDLALVCSSFSKLKRLSIQGCMTEDGFWYLFDSHKNLEYLDCSYSHNITGECFEFASKSFQVLHANGCTSLASEGLQYLASKCPRLKVLEVNGCKLHDFHMGLVDICKSCHQLKELGIGKINTLATELPDFFIQLQFPSSLTKLNVTKIGISDPHLLSICKRCPNLCDLNISMNPDLTDVSVSQLCGLERLKVLDISGLGKITSASLIGIADRGILRVCLASCCHQLGDKLFMPMVMTCKRLEELDICFINIVTMETVKALMHELTCDPWRKIVLQVRGGLLRQIKKQDVLIPPGLIIR